MDSETSAMDNWTRGILLLAALVAALAAAPVRAESAAPEEPLPPAYAAELEEAPAAPLPPALGAAVEDPTGRTPASPETEPETGARPERVLKPPVLLELR